MKRQNKVTVAQLAVFVAALTLLAMAFGFWFGIQQSNQRQADEVAAHNAAVPRGVSRESWLSRWEYATEPAPGSFQELTNAATESGFDVVRAPDPAGAETDMWTICENLAGIGTTPFYSEKEGEWLCYAPRSE